MTTLTDLLRALALCQPEQAPTLALILADWLEEHQDVRCGVLRKIAARGPREVEPVGQELVRRRWHIERQPKLVFAGYVPKTTSGADVACPDCGRSYPFWIAGGFSEAPHLDARVCGCGMFWIMDCTPADAAREFLHRLRVQCLILFRCDMPQRLATGSPPPGLPPQSVLRVDPRWPPLRCPLCEAAMVRCRRCSAEWCLDHQPQPLKCPDCGDCPSDRTATVTVNGQTFQVTDWQVDWDTEADDVFGPPDAAEPDHEVHRRPSYLQRQDYQPPPPRGRAYTADDRHAFKKRVARRRAKKK